MRDMSRDSHVTLTLFITLRSHSLHPTVSSGGHISTSISCSLPKMVQNQRARAVREASLQSIELLAPAFDGHNLRVLPCCCEQATFQHVRHAGKGQGIRLE